MAEQYQSNGFTNVKVLLGGVKAWRALGLEWPSTERSGDAHHAPAT